MDAWRRLRTYGLAAASALVLAIVLGAAGAPQPASGQEVGEAFDCPATLDAYTLSANGDSGVVDDSEFDGFVTWCRYEGTRNGQPYNPSLKIAWTQDSTFCGGLTNGDRKRIGWPNISAYLWWNGEGDPPGIQQAAPALLAEVQPRAYDCDAGSVPEPVAEPEPQESSSDCTEVGGTFTARDNLPVPRARVTMTAGRATLHDVTDERGRYSFQLADVSTSDFDPERDQVELEYALVDGADATPAFELQWAGEPALIRTGAFSLGPGVSGTCDLDLAADDLWDTIEEFHPDAESIDDAAWLFAQVATGWKMVDELGASDLVRSPPLRVVAGCSPANPPKGLASCPPSSQAGYYGTSSDPSVPAVEDPYIVFSIAPDDYDWGDVVYHELGHAVMDATLGANPRSADTVANHGGYFTNPDSTDSLAEGFAEYFSLATRRELEQTGAPQVRDWWQFRVPEFGIDRDYELQRTAWMGENEDDAVTALLVDLMDGAVDHAHAPPKLQVTEVVVDTQRDSDGHDTLRASFDVTNTNDFAVSNPIVALVWYDDGGDPIHVDLPYVATALQPGESMDVTSYLPPGLVEAGITATAIGDLPELEDDDPIDAKYDVQGVLNLLAGSTAVLEGASRTGTAVTMRGLHQALVADVSARSEDDSFGVTVDDIDAIFIAHGFHDDLTTGKSNQQHDTGEAPGFTDHAAPKDTKVEPRYSNPASANTLVPIELAQSDIDEDDVRVRVWHGKEGDERDLPGSGGYETRLVDGHARVDVAPAGITSVMLVPPDGYEPLLVASYDAGEFWADAAKAPGTHPDGPAAVTFPESGELVAAASTTEREDRGVPTVLIGVIGAGVLILVAGMIRLVRRRRRQRPGS